MVGLGESSFEKQETSVLGFLTSRLNLSKAARSQKRAKEAILAPRSVVGLALRKAPADRTEEEVEKLAICLAELQCTAFKNLSGLERRLARKVKLSSFPDQTTVCTEGQPANCFYIIVSGRVKVMKQMKEDGGKPQLMAKLGDLDSFGEIGLLNRGAVRSASVATLAATICLFISQQDYADVLAMPKQQSVASRGEMLARMPIFAGIPKEKVEELALYFDDPVSAPRGSRWDRFREKAFVYFVVTGEVSLCALQPGGGSGKATSKGAKGAGSMAPRPVSTIGPGTSFGEECLFPASPERDWAVVANEDTQILQCNSANFLAHAEPFLLSRLEDAFNFRATYFDKRVEGGIERLRSITMRRSDLAKEITDRYGSLGVDTPRSPGSASLSDELSLPGSPDVSPYATSTDGFPRSSINSFSSGAPSPLGSLGSPASSLVQRSGNSFERNNNPSRRKSRTSLN